MLDNFKATGHPKHLCRCFGKRAKVNKDDDDPIESTPPAGKEPVSSELKDDPIEFTRPSRTQPLQANNDARGQRLGRSGPSVTDDRGKM